MWIAIQNAVGARQGVGGGPGPGPAPVPPPLDTFTGAVAAFSVRKLSSSYSGPCMQVRRDSDNALQDIGFDSNGDLDTAAIATFVGSGNIGYIATLYDQSGNSNDATASTTVQPEIYNNGVPQMNSKPTWTKRSDNGLIGMALTSATLTGFEHSIFASAYWGIDDEKMVHASGYGYEIRDGKPSFFKGTFVEGTQNAILQNSEYIAVWKGDASVEGYINGNETTSGSSGTNNIASGQVIFSQNYATRYVSKCQELILYNSNVSSAYLSGLQSNINGYFNVYTEYNPDAPTSGFLFDYSGAAVAYSVRQLNNNATYAMRVRRTVAPFDEQDIGFDGSGNLDEAAIVAFGGSDVLVVSRWYDQTGNQNHSVQDISVRQPEIYNGVSVFTDNGKPAVRFTDPGQDSNSDSLVWSSNVDTQLFSWSCVAGFSPSGASRTAFHRDNTGSGGYLRVDTGRYVIVKPNDFDFLNGSTFDGTQKLNTLIRSSATTATSYQDGSQTGTISTLDASNIVWGTTDANITGSGVLTFNVQEIILWDVDKNAAGERTGIETNINTYYSIY